MNGYLASRTPVLQADHAGRFDRLSIGLETVVIREPGLEDTEAPNVLLVLNSSLVDAEQGA
jgi:hypothetical protein